MALQFSTIGNLITQEMVTSFFERAKRFPPILCRLLARRRHGAPLSTAEIASVSGLKPFLVEALSDAVDWSDVDIFVLQKFTHGCGIDFTDGHSMKRKLVYLRGKQQNSSRTPPSFAYLRRSPLWKSYYQPMIQRYFESLRG